MSLDFVGMDPDSQHNHCVAVYVDPDTGDGLFVGKIVDDPLIIAEVAGHGNIAADEGVFRMPARMWPLIAEAAAGTYAKGRSGHGPVSFDDLIAATKHSAFHLEMRDGYGNDEPSFKAWQATRQHPDDDERDQWWRDLIGGAVARGVTVRRARIVSEPVSEYIRWEHEITADLNVAAGEQVRWLPRRQAYDLLLPGSDLWCFDRRLVVFNFNAGDDTDTGEEEYTTEPEVVNRCMEAFEKIWDRAIPHDKYTPA